MIVNYDTNCRQISSQYEGIVVIYDDHGAFIRLATFLNVLIWPTELDAR